MTRFYAKLDPVASMVRARFQETAIPATSVSIDEIIVRCTGRSKHTIMMRGKPCPVGYNILALCEAGYCYDFLFSSPMPGFFFGLSSRVEQFEKAGRRRPENVIASTITSWSKTSRASSVKFNYLGQDPASRSRYHYGYTSSYTILDLSMASRRIPQHDRRSQQVGWGGGGPARGTSGDEGGTHEDGKRHRLPTHLRPSATYAWQRKPFPLPCTALYYEQW